MDIIFSAPVVIYWVCLFTFSSYLRKHHNETSHLLGSFGLDNWGTRNSLRVAGYMLFRSAYKTLNDQTAARYLMAIRTVVVISLLPLIAISASVLARVT